MGFGLFGDTSLVKAKTKRDDTALYHRLECRACPLNHAKLQSPKMAPSGAEKPLVYILGEAPGEDEDEEGRQFAGDSGAYLRRFIPKEYKNAIRWNNTARCYPGEHRDPEEIALECCRPFNTKDIEESRPKIILGFGNIPLEWALANNQKQNRRLLKITNWRGRVVPVQIGSHACWYLPMMHPSHVIRTRRKYGKSKEEHVFALDMARAFELAESLPKRPNILTPKKAFEGVVSLDWKRADAVDRIEDFLNRASKEEYSGLDYETNVLRPYLANAKLLTIAVALEDETLAFPYMHKEAHFKAAQLARIEKAVHRYLLSDSRKIVHNLAYEMEWSGHVFGRDILWRDCWEDTMTQASILDERIGGKPDMEAVSKDTSCLGLGFVTLNHLGLNIKGLSSVNTKKMEEEKLVDILPYNGVDAKSCRNVFFEQRDRLREEKLTDVYEMHLQRIPTVVLTQLKGIPVDFDVARKLDKKFKKKIADATAAIESDDAVVAYRKKFREDFNPSSDARCVRLFRDILKEKSIESTNYLGDKEYNVTKDVLEKIKAPIARKILDFRQPSKLASTYIWPEGHRFIYPDGLLHPILNTLFTRTGRLSSEDPNEQNLPKRTADGKEIRKQIVAPPGHLICSVDYGQIEARCIAMASKDKVFVKALWENYDVHLEWAERLSKRYPRVLDKFRHEKSPIKALRQKCKSGWVFALFFGAQQSTAERQMDVPEGTFSREYNLFWETFSGVMEWQETLKESYEEKGYVENLFGRRRRAPISPNQLINAPIQNLASDIVIDGMNSVSALAKDDWYFQPIMNVHDDLTSIFPEKNFDQYVETKLDILLTKEYDFLNVPLMVELSIGKNLCDMQEIANYESHTWGRH